MNLKLGEALHILRTLPDGSVDSVVTDPPSGIEFMGMDWDSFEGTDKDARGAFIAFITDVFREVRRVLRPGGHGLVWALPRTSHWTAMGLENAAFEVRDVITHHYGNGFPKSLNVAKALEGSPEAPNWEGWGTALKPASEHWILIRKPLEGTVAVNVVKHGTGALNIDASRIAGENPSIARRQSQPRQQGGGTWPAAGSAAVYAAEHPGEQLGRWPPNLVLSHSIDCKLLGTKKVSSSNFQGHPNGRLNAVYGNDDRPRPPGGYADEDGTETVEDWECIPNCPVAAMNEQSGTSFSSGGGMKRDGKGNVTFGEHTGHKQVREVGYQDEGGATRFFPTFHTDLELDFLYAAKPSTAEKMAGTKHFYWKKTDDGYEPIDFAEWAKIGKVDPTQRARGNIHPTVKSIALMRWLARLITPPGGTVLDCFMGSGTTGVACVFEEFEFLGIEQKPAYFDIAKARMDHALLVKTTELPEKKKPVQVKTPEPPPLVQNTGMNAKALQKLVAKAVRRR
jgi:DNA modification methylase